jgi:hypothetical protein
MILSPIKAKPPVLVTPRVSLKDLNPAGKRHTSRVATMKEGSDGAKTPVP